MFGLSPVPAMLADPVFGSSEPPVVTRVAQGARGHGSQEERPTTPAAQRDSSLAIRLWPVVIHTITSAVRFLFLFHTHTRQRGMGNTLKLCFLLLGWVQGSYEMLLYNGIEYTRCINKQFPNVKCLVLYFILVAGYPWPWQAVKYCFLNEKQQHMQ